MQGPTGHYRSISEDNGAENRGRKKGRRNARGRGSQRRPKLPYADAPLRTLPAPRVSRRRVGRTPSPRSVLPPGVRSTGPGSSASRRRASIPAGLDAGARAEEPLEQSRLFLRVEPIMPITECRTGARRAPD
jgi:hypothetical protein